MDALSLHARILEGYKDYIYSFIDIHDVDIASKVVGRVRRACHLLVWAKAGKREGAGAIHIHMLECHFPCRLQLESPKEILVH
jgi:hypothetical protein